jgi:hypothetical protein
VLYTLLLPGKSGMGIDRDVKVLSIINEMLNLISTSEKKLQKNRAILERVSDLMKLVNSRFSIQHEFQQLRQHDCYARKTHKDTDNFLSR